MNSPTKSHDDLPTFAVPMVTGPYANSLITKHSIVENTVNNYLIKSFAFAALLKRYIQLTLMQQSVRLADEMRWS